MPSRMERYYEVKEGQPSRIRKNQDLYDQIYVKEDFQNEEYMAKDYTNVEGIAKTPNDGTVNIDRIREMLNNREEKGKSKVKEEQDEIKIEQLTKDETLEEDVENHNINDILNKAKDEREDSDSSFHSLKNIELNILKNLQIDDKKQEQSENENNDLLSSNDNPEEISQLFNTITNASMLNKLGDNELSLDLLDDLKSNGTTMIESSDAIKNILEETKKQKETEEEQAVDKSFYTSTLKLKKLKKSFLDDEKEENNNKSNTAFKIFLIISIIVAVAIIGIIIYKLIK